MKHFTILNRQQLLARSYGEERPISTADQRVLAPGAEESDAAREERMVATSEGGERCGFGS